MPNEQSTRAIGADTRTVSAVRALVLGCARGAGRQNGFTLIETLVTCVAGLVVLGGAVSLLGTGQRLQARDAEWSLTLQEDRSGLARMVRDIRQATKVKEANAGSIFFLGTIGGKEYEIKYECTTAQSGTTYKECVRLAAEKGKGLPATGPVEAKDLVNGASVFTYSPSTVEPRATIIKLEIPAQGTLKQAGSSGFTHKAVLEDAAFMRNLYPEG